MEDSTAGRASRGAGAVTLSRLRTTPGVPIPWHTQLWDMSHLANQEKGDNQPGLFSGFFFFLPLSRSWLIKRPVWEKHALPRDASPEQRVSPTPAGGTDIGVHQPRPAHPPLARGRAGQGLFIDTALSRLPLPEETAPGGDGPDLAVLLDIPPGAVLSGNRRPPGVPPPWGAGQGHPHCRQPQRGPGGM